MGMASIAEIGGYRLRVGFELVAELVKGFWIRFALELHEFWELEVGLTVLPS